MHAQQTEPGIEYLPHPVQARPANFADALILVVVFLGAQVVLGLVFGAIAALTSSTITTGELGLLEAASVVAALWASSRRLHTRMVSLLPRKGISPAICVFAAAGSVGAALLLHPIERLLTGLLPVPHLLRSVFSSIVNPKDILGSIFLAFIVAPIGEEILFRGVMLRGFWTVYGKVRGVFFTALLFGLVHLNPYQFVSGLLLGVFLGFLFVQSDSIVPPIVAHAVYNGSFVATGYLERLWTNHLGGVVWAGNLVTVVEVALGAGMGACFVSLVLQKTRAASARSFVRTVE
jgi:membrane protease YdiL (CAAX protease family)